MYKTDLYFSNPNPGFCRCNPALNPRLGKSPKRLNPRPGTHGFAVPRRCRYSRQPMVATHGNQQKSTKEKISSKLSNFSSYTKKAPLFYLFCLLISVLQFKFCAFPRHCAEIYSKVFFVNLHVWLRTLPRCWLPSPISWSLH